MKFWLYCVVNSIILSKLFKKEKLNLVVLVAPEFGCRCEYVTCPLKYRSPCPVARSHLLELSQWPLARNGPVFPSLCCTDKCSFLHITAHKKKV